MSDVVRSRAFYERALAPRKIRVVEGSQGSIGFGPEGSEDFWITPGDVAAPVHVAVLAPVRATVDAFHREALAGRGRENGEPALRPQYHSGYYGAYVLDPDGNDVEAVAHERN